MTELYRKYDESLYRRNFWNLEVPTLKNPRRNLQMVKLGSELSSSTFPTVPYGLHPRQASLSNAPSVNYQARHFKTVQNSLHLRNSSNSNAPPVNYQATHFPRFLTVFIVSTLASQMLLQWTMKQEIFLSSLQSSASILATMSRAGYPMIPPV